jgi:hypothetical protein
LATRQLAEGPQLDEWCAAHSAGKTFGDPPHSVGRDWHVHAEDRRDYP